MGMYDTFRTENTLNCSSCGADLDLKEGIQTKAFECELNYFTSGDVLNNFSNSGVYIESERCLVCPHEQDIYIATFKGIYIESFDNPDEAKMAIDDFDLLTEYKKQNHLKNGFKNRFNHLRGLIADVESYFTSIKGGRSQILKLYRLDDLLDYNIFKTLRNILDSTRE